MAYNIRYSDYPTSAGPPDPIRWVGPPGPPGPQGEPGVDGTQGLTHVVVADTAPSGAPDSTLWWDSVGTGLYVRYNDGNSTQWVVAQNQNAGGEGAIINVLNHGAKGDGTTDDTAAIQSVLNAYANKATVFLPWTGANYRTGQLTLPGGTNMLLDGVLQALPGLPSGYVQALNTTNIIIRGFGIIDANGLAQTAVGGMAGLAIANCTNVRVSGISLRNAFHWNFNITQSDNVVLDGISVVDTQTGVGGAAPEFAAECNDCWLMNSLVDGTNCGDYAFAFYGGVTNSGAIGNVVRNAGIATTGGAPGIGILSDGAGGSNTGQPCKNITISNNIVHDCQGPGISSLYATGDGGFQSGVIIADNICYGNNLLSVGSNVGDVFIDYSINVLITGNQLSASGSSSNTGVAGIYLGGNSSKITVTGNQIYNIGQGSSNGAGIWTNASWTSISGNHIFDSQTTPTMNRSIIGGGGPHVAIIGNFLDLPTAVGMAADTVVANAIQGVWTVGDPGGVADHVTSIVSAQGHRASLQYQTQGQPRWMIGTDGTTDSGSNVGSNYAIAPYNDAAVLQPSALSINRATGKVTLAGQVAAQPPLMATTTQASAHTITSTAQGSGTNGPATAQIGLNINHQKQNYLTTSTIGEIDGLYVTTRQGGPTSDTGGVIVDVGNTGSGFSAILEGVTTQMAPSTGATVRAIRSQIGAINPQSSTYTGMVLQAQNAASSQAILINDVPGAGSWTNFIEGWLSGSQNFVVTNAGAVFAAGGVTSKGALVVGAPAIITGTAYTVSATDYTMIIAGSGTMTLTLPAPVVGRVLILRNGVAFAVNSASVNVYPFSGAALGSVIMPVGPAKFCWLQGDGTNWQTMMAN